MDRHALDALVTGYEDLIPGLQLPDPDDRHVLAAAPIYSFGGRGRADVIVTLNLKHFPDAVLDSFGIEARRPDEFVLHLLGLSTGAVLSAARAHRESLRNPSKTESEYLEMLERQGLTQTVSVLREYIGAI
jgi:hypothetical protein